MTLITVALIAAIPGVLAGLPALLSYFGNRRDHGNVQERLDSLERTVDMRLGTMDTSLSALASAVNAVHVRQEAYEAMAEVRRIRSD